jgi:hypothetical protein
MRRGGLRHPGPAGKLRRVDTEQYNYLVYRELSSNLWRWTLYNPLGRMAAKSWKNTTISRTASRRSTPSRHPGPPRCASGRPLVW